MERFMIFNQNGSIPSAELEIMEYTVVWMCVYLCDGKKSFQVSFSI